MDNSRLKGVWEQLKGKAKQEWGELTDDDLKYEEGREDEMFGKLQSKLGKTKDEIANWFEKQMDKLENKLE
ncbi:CsbD-like protein [uncultured Paludibacter sp.]|uniref:CsbD-like protein n=1 Tax=uncultured Paludibacter sp. TaxID=497635 RepID=A0A653AEW3_9BACT|nr:CsbD-like protein [uncultured Paludibacter sp.]